MTAKLLAILAGRPDQYVAFARGDHERAVSVDDVNALYRRAPISASLVGRLNPDVELDALEEDIAEIGYPERAS